MAEASLPIQTDIKTSVRSGFLSTVSRVLKYMILKMVMIFATVVVGVYLTIIIANMGGYVDRIQRGIIDENISNQVVNNPDFKLLAADVRKERIAEMTRLAEKRAGLDQPFLIRSFRFLSDALTLNLGRAIYMNSDGGSKQVRLILLERLPSTLVLFATGSFTKIWQSDRPAGHRFISILICTWVVLWPISYLNFCRGGPYFTLRRDGGRSSTCRIFRVCAESDETPHLACFGVNPCNDIWQHLCLAHILPDLFK
jgi:hypothetical protein